MCISSCVYSHYTTKQHMPLLQQQTKLLFHSYVTQWWWVDSATTTLIKPCSKSTYWHAASANKGTQMHAKKATAASSNDWNFYEITWNHSHVTMPRLVQCLERLPANIPGVSTSGQTFTQRLIKCIRITVYLSLNRAIKNNYIFN